MNYPSEFSPDARRAIETEKIRAWRRYRKAKDEWDSDWPFDDAHNLRTWIMSVFLVYARQAIAVGNQGIWAFDKIRCVAEEGLRLLTIEATFKVGEFQFWTNDWFETRREFEAMIEWHQFEDDLLALPESNAGGARDEDNLDTTDGADPIDLDAFPLGENPFPEGHAASQAFEEATWNAKEKISKFKSELLKTPGTTPAEFLQAAATYRKRWFSVCAHEMTLIVGNKETALWYERWIDERAKFLIEDTMGGLRRRPPTQNPDDPPFFPAEELANFENELMLELMRMVAHYKGVAASRVQEIVQLRKAQIADMVERFERLKPILPDLSPAAFARTNAVRERCDAVVGKAKLKREELMREAGQTRRYEHERAAQLRKQAQEVLKTGEEEAAVSMLDAQASEYFSLVGDPFPDQTLRVLAETSIEMYGGEDAVRLREKEWRARWWDRKADEAAKLHATDADSSPVVNKADPIGNTPTDAASPDEAANHPNTTTENAEPPQPAGSSESPHDMGDSDSDDPGRAQKRQRKAADLNAVYSRYRGRTPTAAGRQEELLRDAREYAAMSLTAALEELDLPVDASEEKKREFCEKTRDRIVLETLRDYVPGHKYSSDFQLGAREFKSALWTEGLPSLEDRASAATQELATFISAEALTIRRVDGENPNVSRVESLAQIKSSISPLDTAGIRKWMDDEGWTNETLARRLVTSERAISSLRNNSRYHGKDVITKLANLMGCDPDELYLPEASC